MTTTTTHVKHVRKIHALVEKVLTSKCESGITDSFKALFKSFNDSERADLCSDKPEDILWLIGQVTDKMVFVELRVKMWYDNVEYTSDLMEMAQAFKSLMTGAGYDDSMYSMSDSKHTFVLTLAYERDDEFVVENPHKRSFSLDQIYD